MLIHSHLFLFEHPPKASIARMLNEPSSTAGQHIVSVDETERTATIYYHYHYHFLTGLFIVLSLAVSLERERVVSCGFCDRRCGRTEAMYTVNSKTARDCQLSTRVHHPVLTSFRVNTLHGRSD
eukprot:scaffold8146_cov157-Skeletonema_menzelii.AAC.3